jgi:tRNA(Ile)-lysidine synthase
MILDKVRSTIKKFRLIEKRDKILVGVSGGPDSVALLLILESLKKELDISLHIAHLDHMLRSESFEDREYVEGLAEKLRIPMTCARIDVKKLAKKGSIEEIARNARLEFLFNVANKIRAKKIALGHNLDDQAETVLMRILRGSGLYGLSAMLPKRKISGFQIIRPLIEVKRREIEAYLKKKRAKPRLDISNLGEIYFRNRIRNQLLPLLEKKYNRNIKEILANMAQTSGSDYDYLICTSERVMKKAKTRLNLEKLRKLHPAMQRIILRRSYAHLKGDTRRLNFQHIKEIEDLILNRPTNSVVDLPCAVSVIKQKNSLSFYRRKS